MSILVPRSRPACPERELQNTELKSSEEPRRHTSLPESGALPAGSHQDLGDTFAASSRRGSGVCPCRR